MLKFKPKTGKEIVERTIIYSISLLIILTLVFSFALAEENTETKRGQELSSANSLATILLIVIIVALLIYFGVEVAANKKTNKMFDRAKKATKKAFQLVEEFEKEEREEENKRLLQRLKERKKQKRKSPSTPIIHKRIRKIIIHPIKKDNKEHKIKKALQEKLQTKRRNIHKSKKEQILSEFEDQEQKLINQDPEYLENKKRQKEDVFSKLHRLVQNRKKT